MSGIYKITCTATGMVYIGRSVNIEKRWQQHLALLKSGNHYNSSLQKSWNEYGEEQFSFEVLEIAPKNQLKALEKRWIRIFSNAKKLFNFRTTKSRKPTAAELDVVYNVYEGWIKKPLPKKRSLVRKNTAIILRGLGIPEEEIMDALHEITLKNGPAID